MIVWVNFPKLYMIWRNVSSKNNSEHFDIILFFNSCFFPPSISSCVTAIIYPFKDWLSFMRESYIFKDSIVILAYPYPHLPRNVCHKSLKLNLIFLSTKGMISACPPNWFGRKCARYMKALWRWEWN